MKGEEEKRIPRAEMAESPNPESIIASVNSKAEDSNQLKQNDRSASPSSLTKNTNPADATGNGNKAKSCKGCLYYSSRFKADSRNPLCVGLTRSLPSGNPNFPCFYRVVDFRNLAYFLLGVAVNAELIFEVRDWIPTIPFIVDLFHSLVFGFFLLVSLIFLFGISGFGILFL
ncbi:UNVERIFIED_CONTAM: hypothetical protein Slati_1400000 [Sesamum latifolium]|uniref:DUF8204 domain-containing protein n=1 Tax=Sesamum latifolium TaxID=2727402 RepID=A0AAW2X8H4_9LAMI